MDVTGWRICSAARPGCARYRGALRGDRADRPGGGGGDRGRGVGTGAVRRRSLAERRWPIPRALAGRGAALAPGPTRTLELLGLETIGALAGVPRRSLARRFREADNPLDALDRMLGRKAEPLTAAPFEAPPRATIRLAEPVADPSAAAQALDLLVPKLVEHLATRRLGVRRLVLCGYRVDGEVAMAAAATALPTREARHLQRLLADRTERARSRLRLRRLPARGELVRAVGRGAGSLVDEPRGERQVAELVDRLTVKLGADKVRRPVARGATCRNGPAAGSMSRPRPSRSPARAHGCRAPPGAAPCRRPV